MWLMMVGGRNYFRDREGGERREREGEKQRKRKRTRKRGREREREMNDARNNERSKVLSMT